MTSIRMLVVIALLVGAAVAFAQEAGPPAVPSAVPAPEDLQGLSPAEVMQRIDAWGLESERNTCLTTFRLHP